MTRVLIADDHPFIRKGIIQVLKENKQIASIEEFESGAALLERAAINDYHLIILDISLPDMSGIDVLIQLQKQHPEIPVLIISMHPVEQYANHVMKKGAAGYLTKDAPPEDMLTAVEKVLSGEKYISQALGEELVNRLGQKSVNHPHELLSNREFQVMILLARGNTISEIAAYCSLSPKTISTYRTRILQKLNLRNAIQISSYAVKNNLV